MWAIETLYLRIVDYSCIETRAISNFLSGKASEKIKGKVFLRDDGCRVTD